MFSGRRKRQPAAGGGSAATAPTGQEGLGTPAETTTQFKIDDFPVSATDFDVAYRSLTPVPGSHQVSDGSYEREGRRFPAGMQIHRAHNTLGEEFVVIESYGVGVPTVKAIKRAGS